MGEEIQRHGITEWFWLEKISVPTVAAPRITEPLKLEKSSKISASNCHGKLLAGAGGCRTGQGDTHTQTATRQTVGLGFQAMLFTTPPTGKVFMQRAVLTSQKRTVPSSEPAGSVQSVGHGVRASLRCWKRLPRPSSPTTNPSPLRESLKTTRIMESNHRHIPTILES